MTQVVHTRLPKKDMEHLKSLVKKGYYTNISDAIRQAIRNLINDYSSKSSIGKTLEGWESALQEAEGHLEVALEIFHKNLEKK